MGNLSHFSEGVITHPYPNFNGGMTKPPLELGMDE